MYLRLSRLRLFFLAIYAVFCCLVPFTNLAVAQEAEAPTPPEQEEQKAMPGEAKEPFVFLGVGATSHIDPTRKGTFEDFIINMERICTGCWCNSIFGDNLSESFNDLVGKSEAVAALWQNVSECIAPERNTIAQIRTIPLEPLYDDIDFAKVTFHFSEFLDTPIAITMQVRTPDAYLETLTKRFGPPEIIDDTWYLWRRPGAIMIFDLFNVRRHKWDLARLWVVYTETLEAHLEKVRQIEKK